MAQSHLVNNFCKTHSSLSQTLSQRTKNLNVNTNLEGRSTGGPKTPVQIKDRNSQVSGTNTSMNQQSMISSAIDTENQDYMYGKHSKMKRSKYHHIAGVNPGTVSAFMPMGGSTTSLRGAKPSNLPAVSLFQQSNNRGSNSLFSGKSNSNHLSQFNGGNQKPNPFAIATTPTSKRLSWLEREFTLISRIGRGNFGYVLKCRNNTDQFEYAIKVSHSRVSHPSARAECLQELQTISALSVKCECPHIVRYFNSWIEHD